jgi:hypothetical protein
MPKDITASVSLDYMLLRVAERYYEDLILSVHQVEDMTWSPAGGGGERKPKQPSLKVTLKRTASTSRSHTPIKEIEKIRGLEFTPTEHSSNEYTEEEEDGSPQKEKKKKKSKKRKRQTTLLDTSGLAGTLFCLCFCGCDNIFELYTQLQKVPSGARTCQMMRPLRRLVWPLESG